MRFSYDTYAGGTIAGIIANCSQQNYVLVKSYNTYNFAHK